MRHYEIVLMVHPDKSEKIIQLIDKYKKIIFNNQGKIHRLEDWGRKSLSYAIKKFKKAHFILMNIEIKIKLLKILENHFKFNIDIIRNLIISYTHAITDTSPMLQNKDNYKNKNRKNSFSVSKK